MIIVPFPMPSLLTVFISMNCYVYMLSLINMVLFFMLFFHVPTLHV